MTNYGLFGGINEYLSPGLNLSGCVNDAVKMHNLLTNENTGLIQSANAVQFLDEQAEKFKIIEHIKEAVSKLKQNDTLTIFWSSHGARPKLDEQELYLITHDTSIIEKIPVNAIKFIEELVPIFQSVNNYVMVILDGCQVGDALARPIIANNENIGILSASKREEFAYEDNKLNHGVFTYHLLKTFTSMSVDSDDDGYISMEEAYAYTYRPVVDYVRQNIKRSQHPTCAGNNIHRMNLIKQPTEKDLHQLSIIHDADSERENSESRMIERRIDLLTTKS